MGGLIKATISVTPGQLLYIYVGGSGLACSTQYQSCIGGYNGGTTSYAAQFPGGGQFIVISLKLTNFNRII